jgi:hypothetical protein
VFYTEDKKNDIATPMINAKAVVHSKGLKESFSIILRSLSSIIESSPKPEFKASKNITRDNPAPEISQNNNDKRIDDQRRTVLKDDDIAVQSILKEVLKI